MSDQKNIDNLFRETFKDFEATPDPALWDKISSQLDEKVPQQQKKKEGAVLLPWFYRIAGIAAAILLVIVLGSQFFIDDTNVINSENQTTSNDSNKTSNKNDQQHHIAGSETQKTKLKTTTSGQNSVINQEDRIATQNTIHSNSTNVNGVNKKRIQKESAFQHTVATQEKQTNVTKTKSQQSLYNTDANYRSHQIKSNTSITQKNTVTVTNSNIVNAISDKDANQTTTHKDKNSTISQSNTLNTKSDKYATSVTKHSTNTKNKSINKSAISNTNSLFETEKSSTEIAQNDDTKNATSTVNEGQSTTKTNTTKEVVAAANENKEHVIKKSLLDVINELHELEKDTEIAAEENTRKWTIAPNASPVYYNSFVAGSPIGSTFVDNSKTGDINLSIGVNVGYDVSKRFTIRSGIHKVNYSYNTNDVAIVPSVNAGPVPSANNGLGTNGSISDVTTIAFTQNDVTYNLRDSQATTVSGEFEQAFLDTSIRQTQIKGSLNQRMSYIEVPIELKYAIFDKKIGVNLIGGISTLVLTDNSIVLKAPSLSTELGEATNINNLSFSTNIGIGVDYKLSDKLELNLEPILKYQINTFSGNTGNFRPYSVGVYTGVSFRF